MDATFTQRRYSHLPRYRIPKRLQGRGFRVTNTADIPVVLRSILSAMVDQ